MIEPSNSDPRERRLEDFWLTLIVVCVVGAFLLFHYWDFYLHTGAAFRIQVGALIVGIFGTISGILIQWDKQQDYPPLRLIAAMAVTLVPILLIISTYLDKEKSRKDYTNLINNITERHTNLVNQLTGGDSWPYVSAQVLQFSKSNHVRWWIRNCGDYPLYDVNLTLIDHTWMLGEGKIQQANPHQQQEVIDAASKRDFISIIPSNSEHRVFVNHVSPITQTGNIWRVMISTRNGNWWEFIHLKIDGDRWSVTNTAEKAVRQYEIGKNRSQ